MEKNQLTDMLMCFGLTRQEAILYVCLSQNGELTGYEAAKQTGISRSNAYNALAGLADKGAAYTTEGTAVRYHAVDAEEFCSNKIRVLQEQKRQLTAMMPKPKTEAEGYLTITGDIHIRDKVKNMIAGSGQRIYLSMTAAYIPEFKPELQEALQRGRKVVIITDGTVEFPGVFLYQSNSRETQIGVITDSANVLTGEYGRGADSTCLYSGQPNFVQVFKDSMRNEIELIRIRTGQNGTQ